MADQLQERETHTCDCGYTWFHGLSGSHACEPHYRKRIADLEQKLAVSSSVREEAQLLDDIAAYAFDPAGLSLESMQNTELLTQALAEIDARRDALKARYDALKSQPAEQRKCERCGKVNPAEIHTCTPIVPSSQPTDAENADLPALPGELLSEVKWCLAEGNIGPRTRKLLAGILALQSSAPLVKPQDERVLETALRRIARWHGEFPETGRTWPHGAPMSYGGAFGSHGERDYMRQLALEALNNAAISQPSAAKDAERLDWLDQNLFNREPDSFDKMAVGKDRTMWVFFGPIRHGGGTARQRIDEAMAAMKDSAALPTDAGKPLAQSFNPTRRG
jgi:hypothetical protein